MIEQIKLVIRLWGLNYRSRVAISRMFWLLLGCKYTMLKSILQIFDGKFKFISFCMVMSFAESVKLMANCSGLSLIKFFKK